MENELIRIDIYRKMNIKTCNILGVKIAVTSMAQIINCLTEHLEELQGCYICISNVHTTVMAFEDETYKKVQNGAFMAVPDGKPLVISSRMQGYKEAERIAGPDLLSEVLKISENKGYTHYFYGSTDQTLNLLKQKLLSKYPHLKIAGMYAPPFRALTEEEDGDIVDRIEKVRPDFIWVGLGAPKQEIWMKEHEGRLSGIMLGVGAAFDFHAGTLKRAPRWMQEWCLEWLYRLMQDPVRLFKRYLKTNTKFLWLTITGKNKN